MTPVDSYATRANRTRPCSLTFVHLKVPSAPHKSRQSTFGFRSVTQVAAPNYAWQAIFASTAGDGIRSANTISKQNYGFAWLAPFFFKDDIRLSAIA